MAAQNGWVKIEDRADGLTWVYCYYVNRAIDGKRVQQKTALGLVEHIGPAKPDAWAEVERQELRKKVNNQSVSGRRLTFQELTEQYAEAQIPALARTTQYLHRHVLKDYLLPRWGERAALDIKPVEIQSWVQALSSTLATPTRAKIRDIMHRVYEWGVRYSVLPLGTNNPVAPVECRRTRGEKKYTPKLLTAAEAAQIVETFPILERCLVLLVAATGLRMSEALGLQWQDIDFAGSRIHVRRTWCHGAVGDPKTTTSAQPVPMHETLAGVIEEWHRETPYNQPQDWVFASAKLKGKQPREGCQLVKDYLRPAAVKLGLLSANDTSRFGLHNLRHSLATALVAAGEDVKTVQGILRHAHSRTTLDIYSHSMDTNKLEAQGRFLSGWNKSLPTKTNLTDSQPGEQAS